MKLKTFFSALALTASIALPTAANADSSIPRPEYPRPQFERADWVNLNGEWNYSIDTVAYIRYNQQPAYYKKICIKYL